MLSDQEALEKTISSRTEIVDILGRYEQLIASAKNMVYKLALTNHHGNIVQKRAFLAMVHNVAKSRNLDISWFCEWLCDSKK